MLSTEAPLDSASRREGLAGTKPGCYPSNVARIAVVDDDDMMRRLLCDFLADAGHEAVSCANPGDAVSMIIEHKSNLAILDYSMPGMTGTELLADLRACEETRRLPVVFLSGADAFRFAGGVPGEDLIRFMCKPLDFESLQGVIADLLSSDDRSSSTP